MHVGWVCCHRLITRKCVVRCNLIHRSAVQYSALQGSAVQCSAERFCAVQCSAHCEKLDSSLQQCWQHQSVGALFYAEPELGLALPLPLAEHFWPFLTIFRLFQVFQSIFGYSKLLRYIPGYSMLYQVFQDISIYLSPLGSIPYFHFTGRGFASLKLCV